MRRMRKYIGVMAAMGIAAASCGGTGKTTRVSGDGTRIETTVKGVNETIDSAYETKIEEGVEEEGYVCSGDTLTQYGGKTYMVDYWDEDSDFKGCSTTFVVAYEGKERVNTCRVDGGSVNLSAEGKTLKVAVGVDTVRYDITRLPGRIDPLSRLVPDHCRKHTVDHHFPIGFEDWESQFRFYAYLPDGYPDWLKEYVAAALYANQQNFMSDEDWRDAKTQYLRLRENPKGFKGLDTSEASIESIARYFARRFERLYKQQFQKEDMEEGWDGPLYEYYFEVTPAWTSEDGSLATYRFYTFEFGGGVHGMMYEYYLTFETGSGRILGWRDLYGDSDFNKTMRQLGRELDLRRFDDPTRGQTADVGNAAEMNDTPHRQYYEEFNGRYYPRPALLGDRVVFSYQPYDKGCFAEGILHFTLPFSRNI